MSDDRFPPRKPTAAPERPKIWADGSQKPKFNLRAFAVASLHLTRDGIAPLIAGTAAATDRLAGRVKAGTWRIPTSRLGRAERLVPSHQTVAHWIAGTAGLIAVAGRTAAPESQRRRDRFARTAPSVPAALPAEPVPPVAVSPAPPNAPTPPVTLAEPQNDATLAAIRSALEATPGPAAEPGAEPDAAKPPPTGDPSRLAGLVTAGGGALLGWGLTILALPYGMVRATLAHLNGEDIRRIGEDD